MLIVDSLHATSAGDVVVAGGHLEIAVVWQIHRHLHQSLAIGSCAEHHSAVEVLYRTAGYLARRGCLAVHEHHNGHDGVYWFEPCLVFLACLLQFALGLHEGHVLGHPHINNVNSFGQRTASIRAQVEQE